MLPLLETGKFFELSVFLPVSDEKQQIRTKLNSTLVPQIPEISRDKLLFPLSVLAFLSVLPTAILPILPSQCHLIPEAFPDHFSLKYTRPDSSYLGREWGAFLDPPRSLLPFFPLSTHLSYFPPCLSSFYFSNLWHWHCSYLQEIQPLRPTARAPTLWSRETNAPQMNKPCFKSEHEGGI